MPVGHGRWTFDEHTLALDYHDAEGRWLYDVELERCRTAAAMLDVIMQIAGKSWATEEALRVWFVRSTVSSRPSRRSAASGATAARSTSRRPSRTRPRCENSPLT